MKLFRDIFFIWLYGAFLFLCFVVAEKIYSKFEKFNFQYSSIIIQAYKPFCFRASSIPGLIYEMVPNLNKEGIQTNSLGIRDREYQIPKPQGTFRILILGDSIAYGLNLKRKDIFSKSLQELLNSAQHKINYEVINAAIPGYNTMQEYIAFVNKWYVYKPDLVLVGYCSNDMGPAFFQLQGQRGFIYSYLKHKPINEWFVMDNITFPEMLSIAMPNVFHLPVFIHRSLILHSSLYRTVAIKTYDFLSLKNNLKYPPQAYLNLIMDQAEYAIKDMQEFCNNNHIDLLFVLFPPLYSPSEKVPEGIIYDDSEAKRILENCGITYLELKPYFQSYVEDLMNLSISPAYKDRAHLNALGHKLTAQATYGYLIEYLKRKQ